MNNKQNRQSRPVNSKDTRIVEKFLWFPKRLYTSFGLQNMNYTKEIRWLKKARIKQGANPNFSVSGTCISISNFYWADRCFVD